jgi:hypothetical protein
MTIHQKLRLRVEPEGETPFESTVKQVFNDARGFHIPEEGYSVGVIYDPDDHSKLVIDMETMPVAPGFDRDEAVACHERALARMQDPEARRQRMEQARAAQAAAHAAVQEMIANAYARAGDATAGPDIADELTKLADLRDRRVLTDAEFQAQKAKVLGTS